MTVTEPPGWLTIGIEEEFQIVDSSGELRAHIDELLESAIPLMGEGVKAEFLQSSVEIGTKICADTAEARATVAASARASTRSRPYSRSLPSQGHSRRYQE